MKDSLGKWLRKTEIPTKFSAKDFKEFCLNFEKSAKMIKENLNVIKPAQKMKSRLRDSAGIDTPIKMPTKPKKRG